MSVTAGTDSVCWRAVTVLPLGCIWCELLEQGCCFFITKRRVSFAGFHLTAPRFQTNVPSGTSAVRSWFSPGPGLRPRGGPVAFVNRAQKHSGAGVTLAPPAVPPPWEFLYKPQFTKSHFIEPQGSISLNSGQNEGETFFRLNIDLEN